MLSSNLLKGNWVQFQHDDTRVINSNKILEKRLREQGQEGFAAMAERGDCGAETEEPAEGFRGGLSAKELDGLVGDPEDGSTVIKAAEPAPEPVYDGPSPEELIAQAQEEIMQMRQAAQAEIDAAMQQAIEEGRRQGASQGYNEGAARAQAEIDEAKQQLENAYNERMHELEPEFVKQLTGIYEHIFRIELGEYQNLVMQLLEGCMQKVEGSSNYIIHVSQDDYPFVSMQKKKLIEGMGNKNAALEIVEDVTMRKNECMIEADGGIYDCSLDVQLAALRRELLLLSYEGAE